jgi:hypothetical protein
VSDGLRRFVCVATGVLLCVSDNGGATEATVRLCVKNHGATIVEITCAFPLISALFNTECVYVAYLFVSVMPI